LAKVAQGTRITVVAKRRDRLKGTSAQPITAILRTRVTVITIDGCADTNPSFAMIPNGTAVTIETFSLVKRLMHAPICAIACIHRTPVTIVTGTVIGKTIAVIVHPIANLGRRIQGRARTKTCFFA